MSEDIKASPKSNYRMPHIDFLNKNKLLKPLDPAIAVVGCFFFSLCLILCLVLLDYRVVNGFHGPSLLSTWFKLNGSLLEPEVVGFLDVGGDGCDIFNGRWEWDESSPLYKSQDCLFLDEGFRCSENGRPDDNYTKWRWQPKDCNLPRFDAKVLLEKLRNQRVVFVGDSIGRNQWESLLCMLSLAVPNKTSIYEVNGNPITKHSGSLLFKFMDVNCTIEYYRAPFLILQSRAPPGAPDYVKLTLKLDQMDWSSVRWKGADVLIFNTGHWWNNEKTIKGGCYFQEGMDIKTEMSVENALKRSLLTLMQWINREVNSSTTQVIFRSYSPVHFSGGDWNNSGGCDLETEPDLSGLVVSSETYIEFKTMINVLSEEGMMEKIELLDVTRMTSQRKDGHASLYYIVGGKAPFQRQDCSHWCLPGIPDSWNQLLYALILKRRMTKPSSPA